MTLSTEMRGVAILVIMVLSLNLIITPLAHAQTVLPTVTVGSAPFGVGVNTVTNKIYVSNTGDGANTVSVINGATDTVVATVTVGAAPRGVGVNTLTNKIYVANTSGAGTVSVINGATDTVVATVTVGAAPRGVGVNTATNKIYVSNFASDTVSVIDGATDMVLTTVTVGSGPFGVGVNTATNKIYVAIPGSLFTGSTVSVIDGATDMVLTTVTVGSGPFGVGVNTATNKIYVANNGANTVSVINGATDTVIGAPIPVGAAPRGVGVNTATNKIYVSNFASDTVSVIDGATDTEIDLDPSDPDIDRIPVGDGPSDVGVNTVTNKIYVANNNANTVSVIFDPPIGGGGSAGGCREKTFTNDPTAYPRCVVIDTTPPKIVRAYVTPSDYLCVEIHDDTQTVKLTYNGKQVPVWLGSGGHFCTNEPLPAVIRVVAEDIAGNKSEMFTINAKQIIITRTERSLTALLSEELNPHHGVEGIVLKTDSPIKQIRLAKSPDFSDRELYISEKGIMKLDGNQTVVIAYKGQYGKERYGQIYVFATNMGKLATFDVVVNDDITLYPHQEKQRHGTYDLDLRTASVFDEMNLNAFQQAELERVFAGNGELTIIQQNILSMVLRLVDAL